MNARRVLVSSRVVSLSASPTMVDVLGYLRHTKNALIGNPSAKLALQHTPGPEGPLLPS